MSSPLKRSSSSSINSSLRSSSNSTLSLSGTRDRSLRATGSRRIVLKDRNLGKQPPEFLSSKLSDEKCTVLELSKNHFHTVPQCVFNLTKLVILDVSQNHLTSLPKEIAALPKLKKLVLNSNKFTRIPEELNEDHSIEQLLISHNDIDEISSDTYIPHLRVIYASHNKITTIHSNFGAMTHLQEVHFKNNSLTNCNFVEKLLNLHVLDLSHNLINNLPSLSRHRHLLELNLSHNQISSIPFVKGVCVLNISYNVIQDLSLVDGINEPMSYDKSKGYHYNEGDMIHSSYTEEEGDGINDSRLSIMGESLVVFNISENLISNIEGIQYFRNLHEFIAFNNDISLIPRNLSKLVKLSVLNLGQNSIEKIPKSIDKLTKLKALHLQGNKLDSLPESLISCTGIWPHVGGFLNISDNPLSLIPRYYRTPSTLYRFLKDISQDSEQSFIRNRVMIVGDSGVGKTTLAKKLTNTYRTIQDGLFHSIDSTIGIECTEMQIQKVIDKKERTISLCFWDFGGECQYRDTHAFFSSSSAQYVIVFNVLYPSSKSLVNWFNLIQTTAPGAVVYLVGTHVKKASGKELKTAEDEVKAARKEWKPAFSPKITIIGGHNCSYWPVNNSLSRSWGTAEILSKIIKIAATKVKRLPRSYLHLVSQVVEKKKANVKIMSWKNYSKLSEPFDISERKLHRATEFLHDWGFVFYRPDETYSKKKWIIINPEWLMKLFASVIGYRKQKEHHGAYVSEAKLRKIWRDESFDDKQFNLLVGILESFRLMILWKSDLKSGRQYLIPTLLSPNADGAASTKTYDDSDEYEELAKNSKVNHYRVYGLPYTIPGLFAGLIVNLKKRIEGDMTCWKNTLIINTKKSEARLSLEPTLKELNISLGLHLFVKANSQKSSIEIVSIIHWEISSLLALSYECKLWESVQKNIWVHYKGMWIKREEALQVFNESTQNDWAFCGVKGTLHSLLPEMYSLPFPKESSYEEFSNDIQDEEYIQETYYGKAYRAVWKDTNEKVFIKKIDINENCSKISRAQTSYVMDCFFSEVKVLNHLQHRNIAKFLSYYSYPPVLVSEYLPGGTLADLINDKSNRSKLSWPILIRIAHDVALAVQYLHSQTPQLVHGDLRTDNIMIVELDVNSPQVAKLSEISLRENHAFWVDTSAYVGIIRELVEIFVEELEKGNSQSAVDYAKSLLDCATESESDDGDSVFINPKKLRSRQQVIQGAIGAELVYDTVSTMDFFETEKPRDIVPNLRSHMPPRVVIPKIFQRILQFTGNQKLPDFDQICSMFTRLLHPKKTAELIQLKVDSVSRQMRAEDSPPRYCESSEDE